jgi:CRP-like cAMP-binding protein
MRLKKNAKVDLIAGVPLFAGCSKAELSEIASIADELDLPEGATLIHEDERGREFLIVIDGTVKVTRKGRKLNELGPGSWVGEIALIANVPRTATVVATSPVRLLVITDRAFQHRIRQTPSIAAKVLQSLGERLQTTAL